MKRLAAGGVAAAAVGGAAIGTQTIVPPLVGMFLWPGLVALLLAIFSVWFAISGPRVWLWPLLTGLAVQLWGILLIWSGQEERYWRTVLYTGLAILAVLLIMGIVWLIGYLRARWLERRLLNPPTESDVDPVELKKLRDNLKAALDRLRRMGGRRAVYVLPWQLVIGRTSVGKTVAIKNSGLTLPARKDRVKGVGGTKTCDYFFTKDLIFIDTPGKWVETGADETAEAYWLEQIRLLKRFRRSRPLDGILVVVSADDLLTKGREELEDQAANARAVIDLLQDETGFRFPVYVLISKCDLVEGFVPFFKGLSPRRKHEILGWSNEDPNRENVRRLIKTGLKGVIHRLEAYRLEILGLTARVRFARQLFFFTEEFKRLGRPLADFAVTLFAKDREYDTPIFRGFYFTSGTQGEGTVLGPEMQDLANRLGVPVAPPPETDEPKRGYFLQDLFRRVVVGDEGLISRSAFHFMRRRRHTLLGAFLPAGVAVALLFLASISLIRYTRTYDRIEREVPSIVADLSDNTEQEILLSLEKTEQLRSFHRELTGFTLMPRMGMRRPKGLDQEVLRIFRSQFMGKILEPTMRWSQDFMADPDETCTEQAEVLHSILWLREGNLAEWSRDLEGFTRLWNLKGRDDATRIRLDLNRQFGYLKRQYPDEQRWLRGLDLSAAAANLHERCGQGETSSLDSYRRFQQQCEHPSAAQVANCFGLLKDSARQRNEDYGRLQRYLASIQQSLQGLIDREMGAKDAYREMRAFDPPKKDKTTCMTEFETDIVPVISDYSDQNELIAECRASYRNSKNLGTIARVIEEQRERLKSQEDELRAILERFSIECGVELGEGFAPNADVIITLTEDYRRHQCKGEKPKEVVPRQQGPGEKRTYTFFESVEPRWIYTKAGLGHQLKNKWRGTQAYIATINSESEKERVSSELAAQIDGYAGGSVEAWSTYLGSLELKATSASLPVWLGELSRTQEYGHLLRPAVDGVIALQAQPGEAPFQPLLRAGDSMQWVVEFSQNDLANYQASYLNKLAADLTSCDQNTGFWNGYKAALDADNPGNSLVAARSWVEQKTGASRAGGSLRRLLMEPLTKAEDWVRSPNLTRRQWDDLTTAYAGFQSYFPLNAMGGELIQASQFVGLFGGASGQVVKFATSGRLNDLDPSDREWVRRARELSRAFFVEGTDELRPLKLTVKRTERTEYEPQNLYGRFRLEELVLYLAGEELEIPEHPQSDVLTLNLFEATETQSSILQATILRKIPLIRRPIGNRWKPEQPLIAESKEGWAPLRILMAGLEPGEPIPPGDTFTLRYSIPIQPRQEVIGTITAEVEVSGPNLGEFLRVMQTGFPPLPGTGE